MHPQQPYPPGDDRYQPPGQYGNPYGNQQGAYGHDPHGNQQGAYQQNPYGQQGYYGQPAPSGLSGLLKAIAVTLSALKMIPLLFTLVIVLFVGALFGGLALDDDTFGFFGTAGFLIIAIFGGVILFLAILLIGQAYSALKSKRTALIVYGSILAAIDLLLLAGSFAALVTEASMIEGSDAFEGVSSLLATGLVAVGQVAVVVMAVRSPDQR